MNKELLRITLFGPGETQSAPVTTATPQIPLDNLQPACPQTGCSNPKEQKCKWWMDKIDGKHAALTQKSDEIMAKLAQDNLNSDKRRVLTWKVEKIQEKIAALESRKQRISQNMPNPSPQDCQWRGGRGRGGCRGGRGFSGHPLETEGANHHGCNKDQKHHGCNKDQQQHGCNKDQQPEQRWCDWMTKRQEMLSSKRDSINAKLADTSITPERKEKLTEKLQRVNEKINALETRKNQISEGGCPRRGGRGGWGRGSCEKK